MPVVVPNAVKMSLSSPMVSAVLALKSRILSTFNVVSSVVFEEEPVVSGASRQRIDLPSRHVFDR